MEELYFYDYEFYIQLSDEQHLADSWLLKALNFELWISVNDKMGMSRSNFLYWLFFFNCLYFVNRDFITWENGANPLRTRRCNRVRKPEYATVPRDGKARWVERFGSQKTDSENIMLASHGFWWSLTFVVKNGTRFIS